MAKKKSAKRKSTKKKSTKSKSKKLNQVPLPYLESRAHYLVNLVKRRGGTVRLNKEGRLTHRTPKKAAARRKARKASRKKK